MPSTLQPYRRSLPFLVLAAFAGLMWACGGHDTTSPSTPDTSSDIPSATVPSTNNQTGATVSATGDDPPLNYSENGCMGVKVAPLNFQNDGFLPADGKFLARFVFYQASVDSGTVHLAIFKVIQGQPQQRIASEPKNFNQASGTFTITMDTAGLLEECATYQVDAGCGRNPPPNARYSGNGRDQDFMMSWEVGNRCAPVPTPEPTPDPTPTPTPTCNQGGDLRFNANVVGTCSTPTPTSTPTATPTPTPRVTPTGTPNSTPTPTPRSTPTPTPPTPTPTPTGTPTPTPQPTPTPCRPNYTFSHDPNVRTGGTGYLTGTAKFSGPGHWEFRIAATSDLSECRNRTYDYPKKQYQERFYGCGDSTNGDINLQYAWSTHASNWWRVTLELDGVVVGDSGCLDNPYN